MSALDQSLHDAVDQRATCSKHQSTQEESTLYANSAKPSTTKNVFGRNQRFTIISTLLAITCIILHSSTTASANWLSMSMSAASVIPGNVPDGMPENQQHPIEHSATKTDNSPFGRRNTDRMSMLFPYGYDTDEKIDNGCLAMDLNDVQRTMCRKYPYIMPWVSHGAMRSVQECQYQFQYERWNCTNIQKNQTDFLGPTLRAANKESAFVQAVTSAGIVQLVTRACSTGTLGDTCGCDNRNPTNTKEYLPERSMKSLRRSSDTTTRASVAAEPSDHPNVKWSWGGCSDNVLYGTAFSEAFLKTWEEQQFERSEFKDVQRQVTMHNHLVGSTLVKRHVRKVCRCHGVSGACEFKTCWLSLPQFDEVGHMLKSRYDDESHTVQVAKRARRSSLRRRRKSERKIPITTDDLTFVNKSPSYCEPDEHLGIIGTQGRQCNATRGQYEADSCTQLCCGRGYNTHREQRRSQCHCKFVYCCFVKCKTCIEDVEVHTCK